MNKKLIIKDENDKLILEITFKIEEIPKAIMIMCEILGMPIKNIIFNLPTNNNWIGIKGEIV